jgi:hypothetical protein
MRRASGFAVVVAALGSLAGGCTTALYKGPARPAAEVAVLSSRDAKIVEIDDLPLNGRDSVRYEVLPGDHAVAAALDRVIPGLLATTVQFSRPVTLCVRLAAGHLYRVESVVAGTAWEPRIVDVNDAAPMDRPCDPAAASRAVDSAAQLSGRRPGTGLSLFAGFGFGGDEIAGTTSSNGNNESLKAGQGVVLGVGGMVTPYWARDRFGFGGGVDAAIKYDTIADGNQSVTRFPIAASLHLLANVAGADHYLLAKGGVIRDFGVRYVDQGSSASLAGTWGPLGALGYYRRVSDEFAWDLMGFFALTRHVGPGVSQSADSFGVTVGLYLNR